MGKGSKSGRREEKGKAGKGRERRRGGGRFGGGGKSRVRRTVTASLLLGV